jgi:2-keto-4-pentenoate hydratase/2-oxohepta-3-ene-1,7-dioic acid hydratase in catechol pathway
MPSRRTVLTASAAAAAAAVTDCAAASPRPGPRYTGPHELPRGVTLLSILQHDGAETLGARTPAGVVDVRAAASAAGLTAPLTLEELLREGNQQGLSQAIAAGQANRAALLDEASITHGRLFTSPSKIVCVGLNYRRHALEIGMQPPRVPPLFSKWNNALAPHNGVIKLPPREVSFKFDYETELLIVIGKTARNLTEANALSFVAGYCTSNDFSARDLQLETPSSQWLLGKTLDGFAPIGPYFVSADLVGDPNDLKLETKVNGEVRQSSSTSDFIFNTQQMLAYITKHFTLEPGDLVFTGTPQGVIAGKPKDQQVWLKAGDQLESTLEKLGTLRFKLA